MKGASEVKEGFRLLGLESEEAREKMAALGQLHAFANMLVQEERILVKTDDTTGGDEYAELEPDSRRD
jgi:hypothetical protein